MRSDITHTDLALEGKAPTGSCQTGPFRESIIGQAALKFKAAFQHTCPAAQPDDQAHWKL